MYPPPVGAAVLEDVLAAEVLEEVLAAEEEHEPFAYPNGRLPNGGDASTDSRNVLHLISETANLILTGPQRFNPVKPLNQDLMSASLTGNALTGLNAERMEPNREAAMISMNAETRAQDLNCFRTASTRARRG